ncbi:MAG: hypothetical protein JNN07_27100 [Verrucomicrobiales bacterium]|nr:hypothetical protein [Verrucomicrobiales bacterium]
MSTFEYEMTDLLSLALSERAAVLCLHAGKPPVLTLHAEPHTVEGPVITAQNAESLLRGVADSRQIRQLRAAGRIEFVHTFRDTAFRVRVCAELEGIHIDLRRLRAQPLETTSP